MAGLKRAAVNHKGSDGANGLGDVTQQDERAVMELLDWATSHSKTREQCVFVAETGCRLMFGLQLTASVLTLGWMTTTMTIALVDPCGHQWG